LKCSRYLLVDSKGGLKIDDWGWPAERRPPSQKYPRAITHAPELGWLIPRDERTDLWSIGLILYRLQYGQGEAYPNYVGRNRQVVELPDTMNSDAADLINRLLRDEPDERLSLEGVVNHPYIKRYASSSSSL
jgi:aurora kinase